MDINLINNIVAVIALLFFCKNVITIKQNTKYHKNKFTLMEMFIMTFVFIFVFQGITSLFA